METIERDYSPKGVGFYYVYKALAHPGRNGYITPFTLEERLLHVAEAERTLGSRITWLADSMSNELRQALGSVPNGEFVIDPEGRVARRRAWSDPEALRKDLVELVGAVEKPTKVSDLDLDYTPPSPAVATGIVPRLQVSGRFTALKISPHQADADIPYYVKLRAEADADLLRNCSGKLYVGFYLDPLHHVHWNNLAPPLEFQIQPPAGVKVKPREDRANQVEEPADNDPREFLLTVKGATKASTLDLTVLYYACDDADTFCIPVTQSYSIELAEDRDGGRAPGRGMRPGFGGAGFPRRGFRRF